jgi:hypothetical protein
VLNQASPTKELSEFEALGYRKGLLLLVYEPNNCIEQNIPETQAVVVTLFQF